MARRIAIAELNHGYADPVRSIGRSSALQPLRRLPGAQIGRRFADGGNRWPSAELRRQHGNPGASQAFPDSRLPRIEALARLMAKLAEGADMMIAIQGDTLRFVLLHMFAGRLLVTLGLAYVTHSY